MSQKLRHHYTFTINFTWKTAFPENKGLSSEIKVFKVFSEKNKGFKGFTIKIKVLKVFGWQPELSLSWSQDYARFKLSLSTYTMQLTIWNFEADTCDWSTMCRPCGRAGFTSSVKYLPQVASVILCHTSNVDSFHSDQSKVCSLVFEQKKICMNLRRNSMLEAMPIFMLVGAYNSLFSVEFTWLQSHQSFGGWVPPFRNEHNER